MRAIALWILLMITATADARLNYLLKSCKVAVARAQQSPTELNWWIQAESKYKDLKEAADKLPLPSGELLTDRCKNGSR